MAALRARLGFKVEIRQAGRCLLLAVVGLWGLGWLAPPVSAGNASGVEKVPSDLTALSLEQLSTIKVTSVSKKEQDLAKAAAAIYVITQEDLRRSGATSIPEALRMVPGVQVAQIDANKWAVSARGFNGRFANKLLVLIDGRSVYTPLSQSRLLELVLETLAARPDEERQAPRASDQDTQNFVAEEARQGEEDSKRSLKVLLAEDIPENQALAVELLEQKGHSVRVASNGREALELLERETVDLILMDIQMPEMGGVEATAAVREKERATGDHTPIIGLTAHAMKGDREKYLRAGMDGYVSKPIRREELFDAIEQLTSKTVLT